MKHLLFLCLAACSQVEYVALAGAPRPPLSRGAAVDVLVTGRPKCAYDEIGLMRVKAAKLEDALAQFRDTAASVGADAVLLKPQQGRHFEGVAIAFDCSRPALP